MVGIDAAIANAFRRILLAEVGFTFSHVLSSVSLGSSLGHPCKTERNTREIYSKSTKAAHKKDTYTNGERISTQEVLQDARVSNGLDLVEWLYFFPICLCCVFGVFFSLSVFPAVRNVLIDLSKAFYVADHDILKLRLCNRGDSELAVSQTPLVIDLSVLDMSVYVLILCSSTRVYHRALY